MRAEGTSVPCACDAAGADASAAGGRGAGRAWLALVWPGLVWSGLVCALLPFAWTLGFCFPRGDDFDEVTRSMFLFDLPGGLYEVGREWLTWSGRYTYLFLAVFLGKTGEMRVAAGLVCAASLALHGLAIYGVAREAGVPRRHAAPLGALAVLALCACYGALWNVYQVTGALTIELQSAATFCFFWCLFALWNRCDAMPADGRSVRRSRRVAALVGVLATGVYEHSALAVISAAACACVLAWLRDREDRGPLNDGRPPRLRDLLTGRLRVFLGVALWCFGGLLFSFFAPGNFNRRQVRGIDAETARRQLAAVPADWLDALTSVALSALPFLAVGLALLVLLLRRKKGPGLSLRMRLALGALAPAAFCLFSLVLTVLHAMSDVPLSAETKLSASLSLYAAFALATACFALFSGLPDMHGRGRPWAVALGAFLLAQCLQTDNFRVTLCNAVNGNMALYAEIMETREAWLRHEAEQLPGQKRFRFGLAGEILHPGSRARKLMPDAAWTVVAQLTRPVFPLNGTDPLPAHAGTWPNLWVAWMYGLPAVASAPPQPAAAVAAVVGAPPDGNSAPHGPDGPVELSLPEAARRAGLTGAWRVNACGGPNPTFALNWLVLESAAPLPESVALLVPSPLSRGRMAPLAVQGRLLEDLDRQEIARTDTAAPLAAPKLRFASAAWRVAPPAAGVGAAPVAAGHDGLSPSAPFHYAFPLGPAAPLSAGTDTPVPGVWPAGLFLRLSGETLLRLAPAAPRLDTGPESG